MASVVRSGRAREIVGELDHLTELLCVVFFVIHGAELDLHALQAAGITGLVYVLLRSVGKYGGVYLAANSHIDGPAVKNAIAMPKGRAFLSALAELCEKLNIETIAEMIETPEELRFVRDCGVNYVQGYLLGKPGPDIKSFKGKPDPNLFKT